MESDRKIPALKVFVSQLDRARQPIDAADVEGDTNLVGLALRGVEFTRVWLQVKTTPVADHYASAHARNFNPAPRPSHRRLCLEGSAFCDIN